MAHVESFGAHRVRRLSNFDAATNPYGGLNLMLPPKSLMSPRQDLPLNSPVHLADPRLDEQLKSSGTDLSTERALMTPSIVTTSDDFALAFDIDGVLVRGGKAIPEAVEAMKYINGANPYGIRV